MPVLAGYLFQTAIIRTFFVGSSGRSDVYKGVRVRIVPFHIPSRIEWDLTNGPRSVSCDRATRSSGLGVRSVGRVGDFLDICYVRYGSSLYERACVQDVQHALKKSMGYNSNISHWSRSDTIQVMPPLHHPYAPFKKKTAGAQKS